MPYHIQCPTCQREYTIEDSQLGTHLQCVCNTKFFCDKLLPRFLFVNTQGAKKRFSITEIKKLLQSHSLSGTASIFSIDQKEWISFEDIFAAADLTTVILNSSYIDSSIVESIDASIVPPVRLTSIPWKKKLKILLILLPNLIVYWCLLGGVYVTCVPEEIRDELTYQSIVEKINSCSAWVQDLLPDRYKHLVSDGTQRAPLRHNPCGMEITWTPGQVHGKVSNQINEVQS